VPPRYASRMRSDLEANRGRPPVVKKAVAGLVLVGAAALAIWVVIGVIKTILFVAVAIAVVVAVLWALKTIVW
jgi:uncharacterized membrane protein